MSHLLVKEPCVDSRDILKWSRRIMVLTSHDIVWCDRDYIGIEMILTCGEFPNVPLMGTRGGTNYNPDSGRNKSLELP